MSVRHHVDALDRRQHFGQGRDVAAREDIFVDPRMGDSRALRAFDRMQHHDAVVGECPRAGAEEAVVERGADMREHANRDDAIDFFGDVAIVLQAEFAGACDMRLVGERRVVEGRRGRLEISTAVLRVAIERRRVEPAVEIVSRIASGGRVHRGVRP
jgi:hypothetical protein